ncbi:uncharacterized protein [Rutidosis leptorrhynchoides]|uniref:uncharacterized protein n=1 Tax=Rutidosis leptorrhynchoides TaxID=125765 RepID=UPI003A99AAAB
MRAKLDPFFSKLLLDIGNGTNNSDDDDKVNIPFSKLIKTNESLDSLNTLIEYVYPNIHLESTNFPTSLNRAIVATKNIFVNDINNILIKRFPVEENEYFSFDEIIDPNDQTHLLHSLTPNGMTPHRLTLKVNSPIITLRNSDPTEGLCNDI